MWHEHIGDYNKQFLLSLYNPVPRLENVEILKTIISSNENKVTLIFKMPYYANNPPKKWIVNKFNTTIVELDILFINKIKFENVNKGQKASIELIKKNDIINIEVSGDLDIEIEAEACLIQRIIGLITDDK